jgi:hypothetical protein
MLIHAARGPLFRVKAAPGAMPAFGSAGTAFSTATLAGTHQPLRPATIALGDLLICAAFGKNTNNDVALSMHVNMASAGWQHVGASPYAHTNGGRVLLVAWKIADADDVANQGTAVPGGIVATGGATSDGLYARCFRFTAANGFHSSPIVGPTHADPGDVSDTSITMPGVTPSGPNERAVCIIGFTNQVSVSPATGESGGNWVADVNASSGTSISGMAVQTSDQSGGGGISGGTATADGSCQAVAVGFALRPALV